VNAQEVRASDESTDLDEWASDADVSLRDSGASGREQAPASVLGHPMTKGGPGGVASSQVRRSPVRSVVQHECGSPAPPHRRG
jgi:hypothetical protein